MKKEGTFLSGIILILCLFFLLITVKYLHINSINNHDSNDEYLTRQGIESLLGEEKSFQDGLSNYSLDLELNTQYHYISGTMTFDFKNTEEISLDKLYFHLFPNASEYEEEPGYIIIKSVKTSDKLQDLSYDLGYQLLNVTLPQPVTSQESYSLWIEFETYITNNQSYRLTYGNEPEKGLVYALCTYYPILAVYDITGWNLEPQYFIGDPYYSDIANYFVNLTVPTGYKVASSGQLTAQIDLNTQQKYQFQLLKARDFSFAVSPDFIFESGSHGTTDIFIYYLPFVSENWTVSALDYAQYSLELFTNLYGPYPYPTLTVASTYGFYGGMEWPGLVYIQAGYPWVETTIAHEICHQWFYAIVGNDQLDEGFLDEGIVCYNHWYYTEERYNWKGFFDEHLWRTAETSNTTSFPEGLVINRSINEIIERGLDPQYYWETAYHKAPAVYHLLRTYIGDQFFFNALQRYYSLYSFEIATFQDLIDCFNYYTNINWFLPWFNEGFIPEIEIHSFGLRESIDGNNYCLSITLKQNGSSIYPTIIPFLVSFSDKPNILIWIWCNDSSPITFHKTFPEKPVSISIDPNSGYLYSLTLLLMNPLILEPTTTSSRTTGFIFSMSILVLVVVFLMRKRTK